MSARPVAAPTLPSLAEMERMVAQAGLTLNAGQMADLALGWRQIVGLLARIPRDRALLDDQAFVFRLSPPAPASAKPARVPTTATSQKTRVTAKSTMAKPTTAKPTGAKLTTANPTVAKPIGARRAKGKAA